MRCVAACRQLEWRRTGGLEAGTAERDFARTNRTTPGGIQQEGFTRFQSPSLGRRDRTAMRMPRPGSRPFGVWPLANSVGTPTMQSFVSAPGHASRKPMSMISFRGGDMANTCSAGSWLVSFAGVSETGSRKRRSRPWTRFRSPTPWTRWRRGLRTARARTPSGLAWVATGGRLT